MATRTKVLYIRNKAIFSESAMSDCDRNPQFLLIGDTALTDREIEKIVGSKIRKVYEESVPNGIERFFYSIWVEE